MGLHPPLQPGRHARDEPLLDRLVDHAIAYYRDFVRPEKQLPRARPRSNARRWPIWRRRWGLDRGADAEAIQNIVYEVGKRHPFPELRAWFGCLYQVLLGQQEGPRFGGFVALYGIAETIALIEAALARPADAA